MMSPSRPASIDANCAGYLSLHWTPNGEGMQAGNPSRSVPPIVACRSGCRGRLSRPGAYLADATRSAPFLTRCAGSTGSCLHHEKALIAAFARNRVEALDCRSPRIRYPVPDSSELPAFPRHEFLLSQHERSSGRSANGHGSVSMHSGTCDLLNQGNSDTKRGLFRA